MEQGARTLFLALGDMRDVPTPEFLRVLRMVTTKNVKTVGEAVEAACRVYPAELGAPEAYVLFDWAGREIALDIPADEVLRPGIVLCVRIYPDVKAKIEGEDDPAAMGVIVDGYRNRVVALPVTKDYLALPDAMVEAVKRLKYAVFISYAGANLTLAKELKDGFESVGLSCFLAQMDIPVGEVWQEEIRNALAESRYVLVLLTQQSRNSNWVMCEAGAAWALQKPLFAACMGVDMTELPELITARQGRNIDTTASRTQLFEELRRLCSIPLTAS